MPELCEESLTIFNADGKAKLSREEEGEQNHAQYLKDGLIVCLKSKHHIINACDIKSVIYWEIEDIIFEHREKLLKNALERCIEVQLESWFHPDV